MKTPQRKFVVERKSGRRRLTMQPTSIWGDTDLKALVRAAETEAPHLFEPSVISDTSDQVSEALTEPMSEAQHSDDTQTGDQRSIVAVPVTAEQNPLSLQSDELTLDAATKSKPDAPGRRAPRVAKRRRAASGNLQPESPNIPPTVRATVHKAEAADDELIALEEENLRLKGLLAKHFRQQNVQLRAMLARFGVH